MEAGDFDQVEEERLTTEPREGMEGSIEAVEVGLNLVVGIFEPQTIKMLGTIQGRRVVFLIDGGAMHNFLAKVIAKELQLPIAPTTAYGVRLGDGKSV